MSDTFAPTPVYARPERGLSIGARAARATDNLILRRWFGCWIDFIALVILFVVSALAMSLVFGEPLPDAVVVVMLVPPVLYFPVMEGVWGRSLGKFASGTIVVDAEGNKAGIGRVIVRTLLRLVEVNPFFMGGVPAGICALVTQNRQRIGDLAAGTYVVSVKTLGEVRGKMARSEFEVFD